MTDSFVMVKRELISECARLLNIHDSGGGSNEQFAVEELRAVLAQGAGRGEAVAIVTGSTVQWLPGAGKIPDRSALYADPPAPVSVMSLRDFANAMIDIGLEGSDADGAHIQELAVKHGLLKPEQRTERCGDSCRCAEYADFPVECFRKVKELNQ